MLATWGPTPFQAADVRRVVFTEADALVRRASFGRVSLRGEVTSWLSCSPSPECTDEWWAEGIPRSVSVPAQAAAAERGYRLDDYNRFVYLMPSSRCAFIGLGAGEEALPNGVLTPELVVHELAHTWGLAHAGAAACIETCPLEEDGDYYSIMGIGSTDFTVPEKVRLGWLRPSRRRPVPAPIGSPAPTDRARRRCGSRRRTARTGSSTARSGSTSGGTGSSPGGVTLRWVSDEDDRRHVCDDIRPDHERVGAGPAGRRGGESLRRRGAAGRLPAAARQRRRPALPMERPRRAAGAGDHAAERLLADGLDRPGPLGGALRARERRRLLPRLARRRRRADRAERELVLSGLSAGAHFVSVSAVDRAGNRGAGHDPALRASADALRARAACAAFRRRRGRSRAAAPVPGAS